MNNKLNLLCVSNDGAANITVGRLYASNRETSTRYDLEEMDNRDKDSGGNFQKHFFKKIDDLSFDELVSVAKSLVGLHVQNASYVYSAQRKITGWGIAGGTEPLKTSALVQRDAAKNGFSVYIIVGDSHLPIRNLEDDRIVYLPASYEVRLNSKYDAVVTKDTVTVGCQTFPISILDKLVEAREKLNG